MLCFLPVQFFLKGFKDIAGIPIVIIINRDLCKTLDF